MKTPIDEFAELAKWAWEFLRRNEDYKKDYKEVTEKIPRIRKELLLKSIKEKQYERMPKEEYRKLEEELASMVPKAIHQFCDKWKISNTLDPERTLEEQIPPSSLPSQIPWGTPFRVDSPIDLIEPRISFALFLYVAQHYNTEYLEALARFGGNVFHKERSITIKVDLNYPKNQILEYLEFLISVCKIFVPTHKARTKKKYHFEMFDTYLRVYDLKKENKSWASIAKTLKLNSISAARNHHKVACRMIEKGIDAYVK